MEQYFQGEMMHTAMVSDTIPSDSHPVHVDVDNPISIDSIFDNMSYNKGGCLVRFMINLLGSNNFRNGILDYMTVQ